MANYKNIPVDEETYDAVKQLAVANGLGERGMGAQVKAWTLRDSVPCEHEKTPVTVEYYPGSDVLSGMSRIRQGWWCETCRRVYQRVEEETVEAEPKKKRAARVKAVTA